MNFDVYEINKIFLDQILSLSDSRKYGFEHSKFGKTIHISFNFKYEVNWRHYSCVFNRYSLIRYYSYFYQINRNHLFFGGGGLNDHLCFATCAANNVLSLRELILFMIYMRYLSNI